MGAGLADRFGPYHPAMVWPPLASQFCLELTFGTLLALAFVHPAPVGRLFYRLMGSAAVVPLVGVILAHGLGEGATWSAPAFWASILALLGYPVLSSSLKPRWRSRAVLWSLLWTGLGLVLLIRETTMTTGLGCALASLEALSTGVVAGSVGLSMVLGHWYLTVPNLDVQHLRRLNRVTAMAMGANLILLGASCLLFQDTLAEARTPLFGPWGGVHLGARLVVGLLMPLCFAAMVRGSLSYGNTRSATGILYASTVLVLIGMALALSLQDSYGVPL
jgi:hypothetical protein